MTLELLEERVDPTGVPPEYQPEINLDPMTLWLNEAARSPLLTHQEELSLGRAIARSHLAEEVLKGNLHPDLQSVWRAEIAFGQQAKTAMVESNLRLVIHVAKKYQGRGLELLDLCQEGNLGLLNAVDKFDYRRGLRFSTYAIWWIKQGILRAISEKSRPIRLPAYATEALDDINEATGELMQELHRNPSDEELSERLFEKEILKTKLKLEEKLGREPTKDEIDQEMDFRLTSDNIAFFKEHCQQPIPIERQTHDGEEERGWEEVIEDRASIPLDHAAVLSERLQKIDEVLREALTPRERLVILLRTGAAGREFTLDQIGKLLGLTRERIRQIEVQALRKLRHPSCRAILSEYLEVTEEAVA